MTKEEFDTLQPGMKFKVVDEWPGNGRQNSAGDMDKWLGCIMTVRERNVRYHTLESVRAEEDIEDDDAVVIGGWYWFPELIDYIVYDNEDEERPIQEPDDSDMLLFLFQ